MEMQVNPASSQHAVEAASFDRTVAEAAGRLSDGIHIWRFDLRGVIECDPGICSITEAQRARSFASRSDGTRYLRFRTLIRRVLAAYSGIPACDIKLIAAEDRAPQILNCALRFNISHSDMQLAVAVRSAGMVGIDIQQVRPTQDLALARSVFAPSEWRFLVGLPQREREQEFFRLWVCREAVLKAVGTGFRSYDLELRRSIEGQYMVSSQPRGWGKIGISEFAGPESLVGAVAWSVRTGSIDISYYIVN